MEGEGERRARHLLLLYPLSPLTRRPFWSIFQPVPVVAFANLDLQQKVPKGKSWAPSEVMVRGGFLFVGDARTKIL